MEYEGNDQILYFKTELMKVLFLIDTLEGYGAEKSLVQIALHLDRIEPVFVHLYNGDKLKTSLEENGIKVYSLNISSKYGYNYAVKLISPILDKEKPAILHSTLFRADMVARKIKLKYPNIISVGSFVSNSYGKQRYRHLSLLSKIKLLSTQLRDRWTANLVDYYVCNSKAIKKTNIKALGIPEGKIKVIYRGRSFLDFKDSPSSKQQLKQNLGISGSGKVFLNVSRLQKGKGQIDLLQAFRKLNKNLDAYLLLAGEGLLRKELESEIIKYNLQNKVLLLGYRDDIPQLISMADFFVFPSYFEGLPGALIEATIGKIPSIVSDIPENKECFPKDGALFFKAGDVNELYFKMNEAVQIDWELMLKDSYQFALENFEIRSISKKYEEFYKSVVVT